MLQQGFIELGNSFAFIDRQSSVCIDGKPCDMLGDMVYDSFCGKRFRESQFKAYRHLSPQFRQHLIEEYFRENEINIKSGSCSCSKCKTVSIDEAWWL